MTIIQKYCLHDENLMLNEVFFAKSGCQNQDTQRLLQVAQRISGKILTKEANMYKKLSQRLLAKCHRDKQVAHERDWWHKGKAAMISTFGGTSGKRHFPAFCGT